MELNLETETILSLVRQETGSVLGVVMITVG